jgi:membrane associated rhomboid family serine protease
MVASALSQSIRSVGLFIAILWAVYLLDWILPYQFTDWGIVPRRMTGLVGIPLSPFLHDGVRHLISNSLPLLILLSLFVFTRRDPWLRVLEIGILSGFLLWLFGRNGSGNQVVVHVGASGLIYGLIAYLTVAGLREKHPVSLLIAIVVGFVYGGSFIAGMIPGMQGVSWEGHLTGAVAGGALAFLLPKESNKTEEESPVDLLKRHGFDVQ